MSVDVRRRVMTSIWSYLPKLDGPACRGEIRFLLGNPK